MGNRYEVRTAALWDDRVSEDVDCPEASVYYARSGTVTVPPVGFTTTMPLVNMRA
jgi:hypothetical protein